MNQTHTFNISGTVLKLILKLGNQKSSESLKRKLMYLMPRYKVQINWNGKPIITSSHTLFCFCTAWLSVDRSSKFGTSSARRWHNWAYNWLYLDSSRALSTILWWKEKLQLNAVQSIQTKRGWVKRTLTNKTIPFKTSFESTPTLSSSRHSLSNFSGVNLFSMLIKRSQIKNSVKVSSIWYCST